MSFADHIRAEVEEYDVLIRTFVPHYEEMIARIGDAVARLEAPTPTIVDLGVGTGALAERCAEVSPDCRLVGIDADGEMLRLAASRLSGHDRLELIEGDFLDVELPGCDALVACLALHHVPTAAEKRQVYARCAGALRPGGLLLSGDRFLARDPTFVDAERDAWLAHLRRSYTPEESREHLEAWADEDVYFPLVEEIVWLELAGLEPDVHWRADGFAVLAGRKPGGGAGRRPRPGGRG